MTKEKIDRKIAVIFATDVVGYSKHMETDESETVQNLRACEKILSKLFDEFDARLFNTGGDSFLAEFSSAVSAVECAVAFQEAIQERNKAEETTVNLEFRIGINSGDVIKEKDNLLGDGVNIAARLEALAQTNGITISKGVYDFVKGKTKHEFKDLGAQKVKQNEFHAYDLLMDPSQKRRIKKSAFKSSNTIRNLIIATLLVLPVVGVSWYFELINPVADQSSLVSNNAKTSSLPMVLVRPIRVVSGSENTVDIGAGFTESMIATISKYNGLKIFSSNTSFYVAEENLNNQQLMDRYNVDYTIEGTLQTLGSSSRLSMSLIDLKRDKVIWSENSDFNLTNIFEIQDAVGKEILATLQIDAVTGSIGSSWAEEIEDFETLTEALNWRSEFRKFSAEGYKNSARILKVLENKIGNTGIYYNFASWQIFQKIIIGLSDNFENDRQILKSNIENAISKRLNAEDFALKSILESMLLSKSCEVAKSDADKALSLGGGPDVYTALGAMYSGCGDLTSSIKFSSMALELTPNDNGWLITNNLVSALYRLERYDEIKEIVGENIDAEDMLPSILGMYAAVEFMDGNKKNAKFLLKKAKSRGLDQKRIKSWFKKPIDAEKFIADLTKIEPFN